MGTENRVNPRCVSWAAMLFAFDELELSVIISYFRSLNLKF